MPRLTSPGEVQCLVPELPYKTPGGAEGIPAENDTSVIEVDGRSGNGHSAHAGDNPPY